MHSTCPTCKGECNYPHGSDQESYMLLLLPDECILHSCNCGSQWITKIVKNKERKTQFRQPDKEPLTYGNIPLGSPKGEDWLRYAYDGKEEKIKFSDVIKPEKKKISTERLKRAIELREDE